LFPRLGCSVDPFLFVCLVPLIRYTEGNLLLLHPPIRYAEGNPLFLHPLIRYAEGNLLPPIR